ncbi:hypothetical protein DyAD56_13600 [Dyella sp. AD56]|uniref:hypothetical protein n=1 Tax=Dyella sp. AD56 TaxID=1528744 RepID=UPI000C81EBE2|nr:hypothetical protein [Dyella sp. AD56]PMQ04557.1 hypothetical protein DyAD56_13600 [Dyella sp. AD56]
MDLLPVLGAAGSSNFNSAQGSSADFADVLKKEPEQKPSSRTQDESAVAIARREEAEGEASRQGLASPDESSEVRAALAVSSSVLSASDIATVEQVLSMRVFGLHLTASGYLSEYALSTSQTTPSDERETVVNDAATSQAEIAINDPEEMAGRPLASVSDVDERGLFVGLESPVESLLGTPDDDAMAMQAMMGAAAWTETRWQERSVRLFQRAGGKHVAWLRDYTLSEDEARYLSVELVRHWLSQGISLQSIVWNGRELWSSNNLNQGE